MASLHDVAKIAGVSKSTVSRVINNEYGVKDATKVIVQNAIEQCGYVPNQVAKDLKSQRTNLIGVIVPRVSSHATAQGVDGLTKVLEKAGKHVLLASTHQEHDKELEYIKIFAQKRVEGIILYATHLDKELITTIKSTSIPIILVGQDGSMYNIPSIVHDDTRVGFEAGNRLIEAGCKNVCFLGVQGDDIAVDKQRSEGLEQALSFHNLSLLKHSRGDFSIESGYIQAKQLLAENPEIDGMFCATDRIAVGAIKAIVEQNLTVGKDIKLLGVGNDEISEVCTPTLSTFNYAFDKAGENAAKLLLERTCNRGQEMSKVVLTFQKVTRQTCA
ncbi:LacI family DNA-binding transcriptional regulator [Vibrio astriarenae]